MENFIEDLLIGIATAEDARAAAADARVTGIATAARRSTPNDCYLALLGGDKCRRLACHLISVTRLA